MFPTTRRFNAKQGEKRGELKDGIKLDDNSYANVALKRALGMHRLNVTGFECCHIWPRTCYDPRYHTAIANLVLLPRALASMTDHDAGIQKVLKYRAFELYGWYPDGHSPPVKPANYPQNWRDPLNDPGASMASLASTGEPISLTAEADEDHVPLQRLQGWAMKPETKVHAIIAIVAEHGPQPRNWLEYRIGELGISKTAHISVPSLMTNAGNAYGRVFVEKAGRLAFHPGIEAEIRRHTWVPRAAEVSPPPNS